MATIERVNAIRQALSSIAEDLQAFGAHLYTEDGIIVLSTTHGANENNGAVRVVLVSHEESIPILIPENSDDLQLVGQSILVEAQAAYVRYNSRVPFSVQVANVLEQLRTTRFQELGLNLMEYSGETIAPRYGADGGLSTAFVCAVSLIEEPAVIREITITRNLTILQAAELIIRETTDFRAAHNPPIFGMAVVNSDTLRQFREFFDSTYRPAFAHYGFTIGTALHSPATIQFHFQHGNYNNSHRILMTDRLIDVERGLFDKLREMLNQVISLWGLPAGAEVEGSIDVFGDLRTLYEPADLRGVIARYSMSNSDVNSLLRDLPVFQPRENYIPIPEAQRAALFGGARPTGRTATGINEIMRDRLPRQVSSRTTRIPIRTEVPRPTEEGTAMRPGTVREIARAANERIDELVLEQWSRNVHGIEFDTVSVDEMSEITRGLERENLPPRRIRKIDSE